LVVDGTTDLKEAFDIDEYDWGYFVFWSQGVTGAAGTPALTTFADPMVKGSWYLTERTDDGDVAVAPSVGARFAHFRCLNPVPISVPALTTGPLPISSPECNVKESDWGKIGGTLPIGTSGTGGDDITFVADVDLKCVAIHSIVVRNVSGASNTIGFTILPVAWGLLSGNTIDCMLDTATGADGVRNWGETGSVLEMLGAVASGGRVAFYEFKAGENVTVQSRAPGVREIYVSGTASTATVAVEHDVIFVELPSDFGLKKKPNLNEKEAEFERRVDERIRELEKRMSMRPISLGVQHFEAEKRQKRSLSETRQRKLADAVAGNISPTPSVVADIKASHFGTSLFDKDAKDRLDEKSKK